MSEIAVQGWETARVCKVGSWGRDSMMNAQGSPARSQVRPSRTHVLPMACLIWDFCLSCALSRN